MTINLELLNFCKLNDFYVSVKKMPESNGCTVQYPARSCVPPFMDQYHKVYTIGEDGIYFRGQEDDKPNFLPCPEYCRRVLIFHDISIQCETMGIKHTIISWSVEEDGENVEKCCLDDVLDEPDMSKDIELEERFAELYYMYYKNPFNDYTKTAYDFGVEEGYELLTKSKHD